LTYPVSPQVCVGAAAPRTASKRRQSRSGPNVGAALSRLAGVFLRQVSAELTLAKDCCSAAHIHRSPMKPNLGIAIFVGWMTQLGLSTLLPTIAIVIGRAVSVAGGGDGGWGDHATDPRQAGWHLVQAVILLGSVIAAWIAGYLAPRKLAISATVLILLVLLAKAFEQLPIRHSAPDVVEWVLSPCLGIAAGAMMARLTFRKESTS
jgi:hypothetical protein